MVSRSTLEAAQKHADYMRAYYHRRKLSDPNYMKKRRLQEARWRERNREKWRVYHKQYQAKLRQTPEHKIKEARWKKEYNATPLGRNKKRAAGNRFYRKHKNVLLIKGRIRRGSKTRAELWNMPRLCNKCGGLKKRRDDKRKSLYCPVCFAPRIPKTKAEINARARLHRKDPGVRQRNKLYGFKKRHTAEYRRKAAERARTLYATVEGRKKILDRKKEDTRRMPDYYIRNLLKLRKDQAPPIAVELKRILIRGERLLRQPSVTANSVKE